MNQSTVLKRLRIERGLSQSELATHISSRTTLGSFETRNTNLSSETLLKYLDRLNVKLPEFIFYLQDNQLSEKEQLSHEFVNLLTDHSSKGSQKAFCNKLIRLYNQTHDKYYYILNIQFRILLDKNSAKFDFNKFKNEIQFIEHYLFNIESWGYFELVTANNLMFAFSTKIIELLFEDCAKKLKLFYQNDLYQPLLKSFLLNGCYLGFERNCLNMLLIFLPPLKLIAADPHNIYEQIHYQIFTELIAKYTNEEINFENINKLISIFTTLNNKKHAQELQNFCDLVIEE